MNLLQNATQMADRQKLATAMARVVNSLDTLAEFTRNNGISTDQAHALLDDSEFIALAESAAQKARESGDVATLNATLALDTAIQKLRERIQVEELSTGALRGLVETLHKVSGLSSRQNSATQPHAPQATLIIDFGDAGPSMTITSVPRSASANRSEEGIDTIDADYSVMPDHQEADHAD